MRSILLCISGSRGKTVNQEEMNVANDIEISESLSKVHEQQNIEPKKQQNKYLLYIFCT